MASMHRSRRIAIVLFDGVDILDVTGPASVFATANDRDSNAAYALSLCAATPGPVRTDSGLVLHADSALARAPANLHTLLVPGGKGLDAALADPALLAAIRRLAARAERVVSVCTGAFLLAAAGLLDGLHATTHWRHADALARRFPGVRVEPDAIFVNEGKVWTSAGVTAGLDLALALVEADRGAPLALEVAQALVFYLKRPGGQSQFSVPLRAQAASHSVLDHVRRAILDRPGFDWRIEALADQAHTSPRHLRRLFRQELGMSPRAFIQGARLELAQRLLGDSRLQIADIARRCGYDSAAAFSRRFEARMGAAPMAWRARFQVRPGQAESGA